MKGLINRKIRVSVKQMMFLVPLAVIVIVLSGCNHLPKPEDRFANYINLWQKQNYNQMYQYLSSDSKKKYSKEAFVSRYKNIYQGIQAKNLTIKFEKPQKKVKPDKNGQIYLPFKVQMDTLAGPVSFKQKATLVEEEHQDKKNWYIHWQPNMIFPQLHPGDKIRAFSLPAKRGEITDRNGKGLAINGFNTNIGIVPARLGSHANQTKKKLGKLLHLSKDSIDQKLKASWVKNDSFVPIETVDPKDKKLIDQLIALPGVVKRDKEDRVYPCGKACAHLTGYAGPMNAELLKQYKDKGYSEKSIIGKKGLELALEDKLRGKDGGIIYVANVKGKKTQTIAEKKPVNGENIKLTIDSKVQKALYQQLKGNVGTAVALDPKNGDILGLVSTPSFDPNDFIRGISDKQYQSLIKNPDHPMLSRFAASYAPGSSFKPITAAIALDNGVITPETTFAINGRKWRKDASWGNYYITRLDSLNHVQLKDALVRSDNIYFAQTALKIGQDAFVKGAKTFGFGDALPIQYPMKKSQISNSGLIDSDLLLANSGYGQGQVLTNPVHLALMYTSFVNEGNIVEPHLIKTNKAKGPAFWKENVMSPKTAETILNDLNQVIDSPHGTAHDAKISGIPLAGKTGTAEYKLKQGEKGREIGWFVAVNTKQPKLLVNMMIENVQDKRGSHYVSPKVKKVFEQVLQK
ncbi:penicillin-binding protein [Scopulibacillus daqui]|uniref:Penicillin-binding protein n=1 Tax=Scopulibacillus daqui TaxID=1469162 RepID=A0ABS2Q315_9BACL|nr:penicillin-binding transpeptidase domain-containing protein [Scopulibacillus daqui]MBM7646685.1 penicillin-binding protein [Scopulibacillus daqui]